MLSFRRGPSALPALGRTLPLTVAMRTALVHRSLPLAVHALAVFLLGPLVIIKVSLKLVVAALGARLHLAFLALASARPWPLIIIKVCCRLVAVAL